MTWCHFDRWFAIVAVIAFDGDLAALHDELLTELSSINGRRTVEAKLSHAKDLIDRLGTAGIDAAVLADFEPVDQALRTKARQKVLTQPLEGRAMTPAMQDTPHVLLRRRAQSGHWPQFPADPKPWYEQLRSAMPDDWVSKHRSFGVCTRLVNRVRRLDKSKLALPDRLALHRAFHTTLLDLADAADDSFGNVGETRIEAFETYLAIDWAGAGMTPEAYWQDLCELLVAEQHALTYQNEELPFRRVAPDQVDLVESILLALADEWLAAYQRWHAEEARVLIARLHLAGRRYGRYVEAAARLGSDHWVPTVALAESALRANRAELSVDVFRASDQPGRHREFLRTRCAELTGVALDANT